MKNLFIALFSLIALRLNGQDMQQLIQPEVNNAQKQEAYRKAKVKIAEVAVTDRNQKNRVIEKHEVDRKGRTTHSLLQDYADPMTEYPLHVFSDFFYGYGEGEDNLADTVFDRPEDYMGRSWFGNEYYTWYTYDEKGRLVKRQHNMSTEEYFYNAEGQLEQSTYKEGDISEKQEYKYAADGDNKVVTGQDFKAKFDANGRLVYKENSWALFSGATAVNSFTYFYDSKGLLTKMETTENAHNKTTYYTYDKKNLLLQVQVKDEKGILLYTLDYTYTFY